MSVKHSHLGNCISFSNVFKKTTLLLFSSIVLLRILYVILLYDSVNWLFNSFAPGFFNTALKLICWYSSVFYRCHIFRLVFLKRVSIFKSSKLVSNSVRIYSVFAALFPFIFPNVELISDCIVFHSMIEWERTLIDNN